MNAVSGTILLGLVLVVGLAPRRWALLAVMAGVFFLTQGHSVDVAGLHFYPIRFLEAAAFCRVVARRELVWSRLNRIDWTLLLLCNYSALVWILRASDVAPQQFALALDSTVCYLALRALIGGLEDLRWLLNALVVLLLPFTALVLAERLTGHSAFTIVGAENTLVLRNGVARCQGSFRHATLLGDVAASFLSLYIGLWLAGTRRSAAAVGGVLCLTLVVLSNSGGPLAATGAAALGWSIWSLRERMFLVRRTVFGLFLLLMVVMKAPVWYLPERIGHLVGGGGWHRSFLIQSAWQDLGKWWLAGIDHKDTASWFPYVLDAVGGADVTNQFLAFGIKAGLAAVALLVVPLVFAFKALGSGLSVVRVSGERARADELLLWGLGVTLFVHIVSWWGTSYFDQSWVIWLTHLAAISASVQALEFRAERHSATSVGSGPARLWARIVGASIQEGSVGATPAGGRSSRRRPNLVIPRHSPGR